MKSKLSGLLCILLVLPLLGAAPLKPARIPRGPKPLKPVTGEAAWRLDERWAADLKVPIEWRDNWDLTVTACREKWGKEIPNSRSREPRIRGRYIAMLEALIRKYPDQPDRHADAYRQVAEHLRYLGYSATAVEYVRKAMAVAPGRADIAITTLWSPVRAAEEWPADIVEYSARRVLGLSRVGQIGETDPMVIEAWKALAIALRRQGRLMEAAEALDNYQRLAGPTVFHRAEEASLYAAAGHADEALMRWQAIAAENEDKNRDRDMRMRISRLSAAQTVSVGRFAGQEALAIKWSIMRLRPPADIVADFLPLITEDPAGQNVVPWDGLRYTSLWSGVDRYLAELGEPTLQQVRAAQQTKAAAPADAARKSGDESAMLAVYRRHPWAQASHDLLLDLGQHLLRRGQPGLARRAFADVLAHSADDETRRRAQTGLELVQQQHQPAAQPAEPPAVDAWTEVNAPAIEPWPITLLQRIPPEFANALPWTGATLRAAEGKVIAAGPAMLACFGDDLSKPLWLQSCQWPAGELGAAPRAPKRTFAMPGPIAPAIADGRIFARWGIDPTGNHLTSMASFDLNTGRMLWSTQRQPVVGALWPIGDPTISEGRLYYAAAADPMVMSAAGTPVFVICLDAADGQPIWVRRLADLTESLLIHTERESRRKEDDRDGWRADVARYGNPVTVADGAVYIQTNMGVVARLDARDGAIEWAATYSRAMLTWDSLATLRRMGSAPVLAGQHLILAPRDRQGVFALDRDTGKPAWDRPFAPSAQVIGQTDGLLILADQHDLAALRTDSGEVVWNRRLDDGDARKSLLRGRQLWVDASQNLSILDIRSGSTLATRECEIDEPVRLFAFRGNQLLALTDRLAPASIASRGPAASAGPWRRAWTLSAAHPRLHQPPAGSKLSGLALVTSGQTLSAVNAAGQVLWQRVTRPDLNEIRFSDDAVLLLSAQYVQCIDAAAGQLRWEHPTPIFIDHAAVAGGCLVIVDGDPRRVPSAAGFDLASGSPVWSRPALGADEIEQLHGLHGFFIEGKDLHAIGTSWSSPTLCDVTFRAADGVMLAGRKLPGTTREPRRIAMNGLDGVTLLQDDTLSFFTARSGGQAEERPIPLRLGKSESVQDIAVHGPWACLRIFDDRHDVPRTLILKHGDPAYELRSPNPGVILDGRFCEIIGRTLTLIDLSTRAKLVQCVIPVIEDVDHHTTILDFWTDGSALAVVSGMERGPGRNRRPGDLRIDRFDMKTGNHLQGQVLAEGFWQARLPDGHVEEDVLRQTQAGRLGQTVLIASAQGVAGYVPDNGHASAPASILCYREGKAPLAASSAPGIFASHDDDRLYIRVAYPDAQVEPWHGGEGYGGGDWLQLALTTHVDTLHLGIGVDEQGRPIVRKLSNATPPSGIEAEVRHDLAHGLHTYLLTIPLKRLAWRDSGDDWRGVGLSLVAWEGGGIGSPRPALTLGSALAGRYVLPQHHQRIHLYPLSPQEEQSAVATALQLPQLDVSRRFMEQAGAARSADQAVAFYTACLKQHPAGPMAGQLLLWLDRAMRCDMNDDVADRVLKIAEAAAVPPAIRSRYATAARAHLSQWVFIDAKRPPRMLMLQLNDGASWDHRISFGQFQAVATGTPHTPSRRLFGSLPPAGQWHELRIPLSWLDMHDKPIAGLLFGQHGGAKVFWDRTAIVADGKEQILIEDATPEGQTGGFWDWTSERSKSGGKSHTQATPPTDDEPVWHDISALKTPGTLHLAGAPATGAPDPAAAIAAIQESLPKLGPGELAVDYLKAMLALEGPDAERRAVRLAWFLKTLPAHPANTRILADLLQLAREMKKEDPGAYVDAMITEAKVPLRTRYAFRRACTHTERAFLRDWQVIGPFANINDRGLEFPYPPELERTRLEAEYRGAVESVKWKLLQSDREYINLLALTPNQQSVGYAVCWVRSEKPRPVMLEIGSDDGSKVWVNRRLVHSQHTHDYAERGNWRTPAYLTAGWNEILVKIEQNEEEWGFYLELVDPEGRGGLKDLTIQTQAP